MIPLMPFALRLSKCGGFKVPNRTTHEDGAQQQGGAIPDAKQAIKDQHAGLGMAW
jgi:hypothetical protein